MAQLVDPRFLLTDASNVPQNGAKLRIYDAGTTNLTSVFSDSALSVPLTNPVVASSSGILPQVFAAEGTVVDLQWLTSADVSIPGRSYEDVTFVGADTGDLTRTVTGNARFKLTGSGGANLWQVGDASPDNTGGTLTIEGWAGTQGDNLTLDFAATNATGRITEQSKKLQGTVFTEATQVTAQTSVDILLPNDPTGCRAWEIHIWDYSQSGLGNLQVRLSYDSGATYKAAATDYDNFWFQSTTGGSVSPTALVTAAQAEIASNLVGAANQLGGGLIRVITPDSGTAFTKIDADLSGIINTGAGSIFRATAYGKGSYGRATNIRLLLAAVNFTFKYRVVPLRGFGEA